MRFNEQLMNIRRQKGLSQEQLGEMVGVSRQTVSKWELGETTPEMEKLIQLSNIFDISMDILTGRCIDNKGCSEDECSEGSCSDGSECGCSDGSCSDGSECGCSDGSKCGCSEASERGCYEGGNNHENHSEPKSQFYNDAKFLYSYAFRYEYKSPRTFRGLPLVHINIGRGIFKAKGVLAIGGLAVGLLAIGGCAIGVYSIGGCAIATKIAAGGYAHATVAIGDRTSGEIIFDTKQIIPKNAISNAILQRFPHTWKFIVDLFDLY